MITTFLDLEGKEHNFTTQQYITGLYVIEDNKPELQYEVTTKEIPFHKKLRINIIKEGFTLIVEKSTEL